MLNYHRMDHAMAYNGDYTATCLFFPPNFLPAVDYPCGIRHFINDQIYNSFRTRYIELLIH